MLISVILPTMGRPERARACVERVLATTDGYELQVIVAVDDDRQTLEIMQVLGVTISYCIERRGKSQAWNDGLALARGDYIVSLADDVQVEPGWLREALVVMPEGGGLVGFNDTHTRKPTHWIASRNWIIEGMGGVMAWPCYLTSHNDVETHERAVRAGRYAWAEKAIARHDHPIFDGREWDDTDRVSQAHWQESRDAFLRRAALDFPNDYEPVLCD